MTLQNLELVCAGGLAADDGSDLVDALRRGEPAAIGCVYDAHHQAVRAFAQRVLGDPATAEDLVHEVFVRLPKAVQSFRGDCSLRTLLISVAVNHARHFVRAAARHRAALERMAVEPRCASDDPEHLVRRRELAHALSRALEHLPLEQRVAFVLCEIEQRSSAQAARIVGCPEATMRTRLFHARRKLRQMLEQEMTR